MSAIVFLGPSLSLEGARRVLEADYRPPAKRGDVLRALAAKPAVVGLVDGYFHAVPSVWHKEILWALGQGVRVLGAASMGALRAAELEPFGMEGVGSIFAAFRDGTLTGDDEVAVLHGPEELGYPVVSEALVNIRATLAAAETRGVVTAGTRHQLECLGKAAFYPDRSYARLLADGRHAGLPATELDALREFLPEGRVDRKRLDALEMLAATRVRLTTGVQTGPRWHFEVTEAWQALTEEVG